MFLKIISVIIIFLYQTNLYSKAANEKEFNQEYLSNYFSGLLSYDNQKNNNALKFFENSKILIQSHDNFLKEYAFSLLQDGQVKKAINQIKYSNTSIGADFFEANLLLVLDSINKRKFKQASLKLKKLEKFKEDDSYKFIIYSTLKSYIDLFIYKKSDIVEQFGKLDLINMAFQNCYLNSSNTESYFLKLINDPQSDYSRYIFFYLSNRIYNNDILTVNRIAKNIDQLGSTLLISQVKKWVDDEKYQKLTQYFSCQNENDILSEFFFLISNFYSSQNRFDYSNIYLNIANFLNPKFYFNLSLIAENHESNNNYDLAKKTFEKFDYKDEIFFWYKTKKIAQIISEEDGKDDALKYILKNVKKVDKNSTKIIYDLANIYKNHKKYDEAIKYYSIALKKLDENSREYADILYRRGGSYERLNKFDLADKDLLNSIKIRPDEPYTLNYLAYSWLERGYKIKEAIEMLNKAYKGKENDPYITDSVGWGYYLTGDYEEAEIYLRKAVELLPSDPIASDHYGDVLWKLNRKIQASYFWKSALNSDEADEKLKNQIKKKLYDGLKNNS
tara:strand:- start:849 stop:2528 length:1680 start_codon:yes stop_codon:yes gene_type:complete